MLSHSIRQAAARRADAGLPSPETTTFRLVHDQADSLDGVIVDVFGTVAVLRLRTRARWSDTSAVVDSAHALKELGYSTHVIVDEPAKHSERELQDRESTLAAAVASAGCAPKEAVGTCLENGLAFEYSIDDGFSQGLFLDMRDPRRDLRHRWSGRRVMNLFAYTCGFGVALAEHNDVTNVDVSRKYLDWGKRNYALNDLSIERGFVRKDAFEFLEIAVKKGFEWDAVILDPPVFSRGKKGLSRRFSLRSDLESLIDLGLRALGRDGELFVSTNLAELDQQTFRGIVERCSRERGRRWIRTWEPAADYPVELDAYHLKTALVG